MVDEARLERTKNGRHGHPTTRRAFITTLGFGVVSLYGLWAAYGVAPTSLSFLSSAKGGGHGGMAGMGHGAGGGMDPEEFRRLAHAFAEANKLADGSVKPVRVAMTQMSSMVEHGHKEKHAEAAGHDPSMAAMDEPGENGHEAKDEPIEVYAMAARYGYVPSLLRLERDVPYKFRMMAVDANHGMSIKFRVAGHMIRCPARTMIERTLTFTEPGEQLIYCTVYCGAGHDMMMGKIVVT